MILAVTCMLNALAWTGPNQHLPTPQTQLISFQATSVNLANNIIILM